MRGARRGGHLAWWGIPYGAPPTGARRFAPPEPADPWEGVRDCSGGRDPARQCARSSLKWSDLLDPRKQPRAVGREDCLHLDVYRPALDPGRGRREGGAAAWAALPVLVYIHGGGFKSGDPPEGDTYHFWKLAEDVGQVIVSVEYRLGPLGFLALEELRTEAGGLGNFGLQDQRLALSWVQENILAFGGDPDRVTLFGESAGAMAICAHVGSPGTKGLFARAIVQSGNCESPLVFKSPAQALGGGEALREGVGCGGLGSAEATRECMRRVPVEDLLRFPTSNHAHFPLSPILDWGPVVDGVTVERRPLDAVQQGSFNDAAEVVIGSAKNDGSVFGLALPLLSDKLGWPETMLRGLVDRIFGPAAGKAILRQFPRKGFVLGVYPQIDEIVTDYLFRCSARRFARALASRGRPAWLYEFSYAFQGSKYRALGDYHTSENKWLFGGKGSDLHLTGADAAMQAALQGYWGNFSAGGDPNGAGGRGGGVAGAQSPAKLPAWPVISETHPSIMILTQNPAAAPAAGASSAPREAACDFWDGVAPLIVHGGA